MKFDYQLLYVFVAIGLMTRKLSWRGWAGVSLLVAAIIIFNWLKG